MVVTFMNLHFSNDHDFHDFTIELKNRLASRPVRELDRPSLRASAVMMLIMEKDNEAQVLLTKRTSKVGTHKGDMSFPGGTRDEEDKNLLSTALRETQEEVGIAPEDIEVLGEFDHFMSIAGFHVSTFIGIIPYPCAYTVSEDEIEACVEVPLHLFRDKKFDKKQEIEFEGDRYNIYHYYYGSYEIWGLTARILTDFGTKILAP